MAAEQERISVRFEVRCVLRGLVQEAQRQGCVEDVRRFPDVFVACVLQLDVVAAAVTSGQVTIQDIIVWLDVLIDGGEKHGTASV